MIALLTKTAAALALLAVLSLFAYVLPRLPRLKRFFIPDVALLLLLGGVINAIIPYVHTLILFATSRTSLTIAASLLIFYGGAELTKETMRKIWKPVLFLATIGVAVSVSVLGFAQFSFSLGHFTLFTDLLMGAILAGTDPTVLISLLDVIALRDRIKELLIAESALNDPVSALFATTLLSIVKPNHSGLSIQFLDLSWQVISAVAFGYMLGRVLEKLPQQSLWKFRTVRVISSFLLSSLLSSLVHSSPFLMAFTTGFFARPLDSQSTFDDESGEHKRVHLPNRSALDHQIFEWLLYAVRSYLFLALGLSFPMRASADEIVGAILTSLLLILVARPLSVFTVKILIWRDFPMREAIFCACNRQTGVIPALFANELLQMHFPHAKSIDLVVTFSILATSVFLLPAFRPLANFLKLSEETGVSVSDHA
ncbi:cation:proton antiporter [Sulfoacidibacillus thermotolerans]|uniref:Cation/H+ exchanger transmembrane domain-containing protein n=1 Tax=Sulfoacidibacillus thermotolerans TaxID=1765684 RepID=A0A2U3D6H1_SULT2|nr:cation:proton antiporter [Sulfoacidibacillus thermotolerans]PWI56878.1 hypothetical protein BM613_11630 [Sulfoacidibacillus thermotolerans]